MERASILRTYLEEVGKKPLEKDHAMIRNSHNDDNISIDNQFYLNDAGSTAGTYIKKTEQFVMEEDLTIGMGSNQFMVTKICMNE